MTAMLLTLLIALFGNALIYAGIAFINAQLFPSVLGGFYDSVSLWPRVLMMSVVSGVLGNYLFSLVYRLAGPSGAGMMIIGTLAFVLVVKAMLLNHTMPTLRIGVAAVALIGAALWVVHELGQAGSR